MKNFALDMCELRLRGWTLVDGISSQEDMLELGRAIGSPTLTPNGEFVKQIRQVAAHQAPRGSQSSIYGTGPFPLHTDTVFWPTPVRYVILRGYGDTRRSTTVKSFKQMTIQCDSSFPAALHHAVFRVSAGSKSFYCSLRFQHHDDSGWRYDADLMYPVNSAAERVHSELRELVMEGDAAFITWSESMAAVICNWTTLHGRGEEPPNEGLRVIERLYVR